MTYYFESIDSTNKYIKEHVQELNDFDIVSAGFQTAGKGRNDHIWQGQANQNIYSSICIKNKDLVNSFNTLSIAAGVVVMNFLSQFYEKDKISLKWPNDVYINGQKICGILLEGQLPNYVVVGIGININQNSFEIDNATSLSLLNNKEYDLNELRDDFHFHLLDELQNFNSNKQDYIDTFNKHNYLLGKEVSFNYNRSLSKGVAESINNDGSLQVKQDNKTINVFFDEVSIIR